MTDTCQQAFEIVRGHEGSELDLDASDRGNWTGGKVGVGVLKGSRFGVSAASYPDVDIAALTVQGACEIFRADYWRKVGGDDLPAQVALLVADAAWQHGAPQSVRWLQQAAGAPIDGVIGTVTVTAAKIRAGIPGGFEALAAELLSLRLIAMSESYIWKQDRDGFLRRVMTLAFQAMQFTGATSP